ncbi:MAG: hypothetical protein JF587_15715 [Catenulisporales bacterium]|nr:hypothetical protein [Catenulisporales bacterium]
MTTPAGPLAPAPTTVLPAGRAPVCRAVMDWLGDPAAPRVLLVTGPAGTGKTFTLAWTASELAVLAEAADDERFAWVSARGLTPRVLAWQLAGQLGVTVRAAGELAAVLAGRLRGSAGPGGGLGAGAGAREDRVAVGDGFGGTVQVAGLGGGELAAGVRGDAASRVHVGGAPAEAGASGNAANGGPAVGGGVGVSANGVQVAAHAAGAVGDETANGSPAIGVGGPAIGAQRTADIAGASAVASVAGTPIEAQRVEGLTGQGVALANGGESAPDLPFATRLNLPGSRSATWDLLSSTAAAPYETGRWSRITILISELDLAGHLRDGSARAAVVSELIAPLIAVPGVRLILESREADLPGPTTVIDLSEPRWTDKAEFAAWLDDLVPSGGAAAPQAYPNPSKAREILSLAVNRHAGLLAASDERPWKLAAVPFDVAFREGIADQIVLEPANLVLVQQPALSTAIDALGAAVSPGTRAAWRVAGQALTNAVSVPERAAILHGAALAVGDHSLAEAVAPYTRGIRPSDGAPIGDPTRWLTRWAGWRPLPPDTPRPTPWPGPVAALAMSQDTEPSQEVDDEPERPRTLVAIDDLARAYRLDPRDGRILARPAVPVMVKARAVAVVDAAPSLVLTDASRRLAALGPNAPRGLVSAVRDVLPDTAVTAVSVAREALVFGSADGCVHVWDTVTEELIADPEDQHSGAITAVSAIWMPDVDVLFALSGSLDGTFRLWAVPADASLLPVEDRGMPVTAITAALTGVGPVAAVAWADGHLTVWDLAEARTGRPIPLGWVPKALALGEDGLLVAAGEDGVMAIDLHLADFFEG